MSVDNLDEGNHILRLGNFVIKRGPLLIINLSERHNSLLCLTYITQYISMQVYRDNYKLTDQLVWITNRQRVKRKGGPYGGKKPQIRTMFLCFPLECLLNLRTYMQPRTKTRKKKKDFGTSQILHMCLDWALIHQIGLQTYTNQVARRYPLGGSLNSM